MKIEIKIVLILIIVFFSVPLIMTIFQLCPPPGPWPKPPWCTDSIKGSHAVNLTELPEKAEDMKILEVNITVTVPYWTKGDVYLSAGDNAEYFRLEKINDVIYQGKASLKKGTHYNYSLDKTIPDITPDRKINDAVVLDYVLDWSSSNKTIIKTDFQKSFYIGACHFCGVSITKGNFTEPIEKTMDEIKNSGGNWINLVPMWFIIPDYRGSEIMPIYSEEFKGTSGWVTATIKDEDLLTLINEAHSRDLKVYLSPHIAPENWGPGIKGKGDLEPSDPDTFFINYKNFINHYADIAQNTGVEMFSVGNEMDTLTQEDLTQNSNINKTARWRGVISSLRQHYNGALTYSVSCSDEKRCGPQVIKFWDDLDVIGWEWYVPIASGEHESISVMKANAERIIQNNMKPLYLKYNKPIVLTEIGWEAYPGSCAHTYGVGPSKGGDRIEQAGCYEAVFQAIENKDFIKGMHIWSWTANREGDRFKWVLTDSANEVRFSIAEKEIGKWYKKIQS